MARNERDLHNWDGQAATMELINKLHNEVVDNLKDATKYETRLERYVEDVNGVNEKVRERDRRIQRLESNNKMLETARNNNHSVIVKQSEVKNSLQTLVRPLLNPKTYLQIKMKQDGSISLHLTPELDEAVKFAQQGMEEEGCQWIIGYAVKQLISCLNVDAPEVLAKLIGLEGKPDTAETPEDEAE